MTHQPFTLSSPAFGNGQSIPLAYTCKGANISPPLHIEGAPEDTERIALIMHDPDAPHGDFLHWSLWDIGPTTIDIDEDIPPIDAVEGTNDFGEMDYGGPCPPSGIHRYEFDLYALDGPLGLPFGASRIEVEEAIRARAIAKTTLIGTVSALI